MINNNNYIVVSERLSVKCSYNPLWHPMCSFCIENLFFNSVKKCNLHQNFTLKSTTTSKDSDFPSGLFSPLYIMYTVGNIYTKQRTKEEKKYQPATDNLIKCNTKHPKIEILLVHFLA